MDEVFKALADPTRRAILDALFERDGQTVQALCDRFPEMTRFGVMKHLTVLEAANLVATKRVGRTKLHFLNPVPIGEIADRWVSKYAQPFTRAMVGIRHDLEREPALHSVRGAPDMAITKHVYQIYIKATPEQVWDAIIEPSLTRRYFHGTSFDSPPVKGEPYRTTDRRRAAGDRRRDRGAGSAAPTGHDVARALRRGDGGGTAEPRRVDVEPVGDRPDPGATGARRPGPQPADVGQRERRLGVRARRLEDGARDRRVAAAVDRPSAADRSTMRRASGTGPRRSSATTRRGR